MKYSAYFILVVAFVISINAQLPPNPPPKQPDPKSISETYKSQNLCAFLSSSDSSLPFQCWTCGLPFSQPFCGSKLEIKYDCCPGFKRSPMTNNKCGETESTWKLIHTHLKDYSVKKFGAILEKNHGLSKSFSDMSSKDTYTVFAPYSDDAMKDGEYDLSTASGSPHPIQMHISKNRVYSRQLTNGAVIDTVSNHKLKVTSYSNGLCFVECRAITNPDHEAKNGVIHYLSGAIKPHVGGSFQRKTVLQALQNGPDTNAFYQDTPADVRKMLDQDSSSKWFTVLAPSNSAWNAAKSKYTGAIDQLVRNHILSSLICSMAITQKATSLGPTLSQEYLGVDCKSPNSRTIISACGEEVSITKPDLMAGNGVVQVIDGVLPPLSAMDVKQAAKCQSTGPNKYKTSQYANLVKDCDLKMSSGSKYIVLVPTDKAFEKMSADPEAQKMYDDVSDKCDVLRYNVLKAVGGNDPPAVVSPKMYDTTYSGPGKSKVNALFVPTRDGSKLQFNNACTKHKKPHKIKNGVMYLVDKVLVPPTKTIMQLLSERPDNKFVYKKMQETGYGSELASAGQDQTFLAPVNHGFGTRKEKKYSGGAMKSVLKLQTINRYLWTGDDGNIERETVIDVESKGTPKKVTIKRTLEGNTYIGHAGLPFKEWGLVLVENLPATDGMLWIVDWPMKS